VAGGYAVSWKTGVEGFCGIEFSLMDEQEFLKLVAMKEREAAEHRRRKLQLRGRIAEVILARPEWALERAKEFLNKPAQPWQRWSRTKWREFLETKSPREISELLANPDERSQALSESHPFAACMLYMAHGR
jgi:hypothetical protein